MHMCAHAPIHHPRLDTRQADGTLLYAAVDAGEFGYVYSSNDGGVTWVQRNAAGTNTRRWFSMVTSANGSFVAAAAYNSFIYTSSNGGVTWSERTSAGSRPWYGLASSTDG